jgi:cytoskeletal protein CcmA (bactofilin family)
MSCNPVMLKRKPPFIMNTLFRKLFPGKSEGVPDENFYISAGLQFYGDLVAASSSGRIEGKFDGHIIECKKLIIGPQATIKGNIFAQEVIVYGYCEGHIFASKMIKVYDSAVVLGDVHSSSVLVERNATFKGNLKKLKPEDYAGMTEAEKEKIRMEKKSNVFNIHRLTSKNESEQKARLVANGGPETLLPISPVKSEDPKPFMAKVQKRPPVDPTPLQKQADVVIPIEPGFSQKTDNPSGEGVRRWF